MGRVHALHVELGGDDAHHHHLDEVSGWSIAVVLVRAALSRGFPSASSQAARDDITLCDEDCAHGGEEKGRPLAEHGNYGDEVFRKLGG